MSALINEMVNIGAYVARWWRQISVDSIPLISWMLALWALSIVVSAVGAFIGIGFPSVGGAIFGKIEAGRYVRRPVDYRSRGDITIARDREIRAKGQVDAYWRFRDGE